MSKKTYYLASPWELREDSRKFQKDIEKSWPTKEDVYIEDRTIVKYQEFGFYLVHPFYDIKKKELDIPEGQDRIERAKAVLKYKKEIVEKDLDGIRKSDGVIFFLLTDKPVCPIGSLFEIAYASMLLRIPVYILTNKSEFLYHPWINYYCKIFKNKDELIEYLKNKK